MNTGAMTSQICRQPVPTFGAQEHGEVLNERFSRCRGLLNFIACRVPGRSGRAELAVENTWLTASLNPTGFEYEGEFRSWLLRILIDEALAILHMDRQANRPKPFAMTHQQSEEGVQHVCK